jgi:glutamate-1-semialdehyde 2,1-aminomutase
MSADNDVDRLRANARGIAKREGERLLERTPTSARLYERARAYLPLGVASSFQSGEPYPFYLSGGEGAFVWDADDNRYLDVHNGFGVTLCGHAHPKIVEAIERAARSGTHFAAMTESAVDLGIELCSRFRLERVRFANSGTEATMEAIRVARAATGRTNLVKVEGGYHGHHDAVMFSVAPDPSELVADLEGVRELCTKYDVVLIFDEVKTGVNIAPGGATERFGVQPDLACFAKAIGGGVPIGAFGGRVEVMGIIEQGEAHLGTINGNPLAMSAGLAALTEVLTPEAHEHISALGTRLSQGCRAALETHDIPAHVIDLSAKGGVCYRPEPMYNYRDSFDCDGDLLEASSPWFMNRGVFQNPGDKGQWMLSVQHTAQDIDTYVEFFAEYCAELAK